jgi:Methylamine utilisation protein MauE
MSLTSQTGVPSRGSLEQLASGARLTLRILFAILLTVAGVAKLLDMTGFYQVVRNYQSLPDVVVPPAAWLLAVGEIVLAAWLMARYHPRRAAITVVLLHLMYLVWLLVALLRGLELDNCGCFGVFWARPLTWYSPLEDLVLVGLAMLYWRLLPQDEVAS